MKRTFRFAKCEGYVTTTTPDSEEYSIPVFPGILKHPDVDMLFKILTDYAVARKYTIEALEHASWPLLKCFPASWLEHCIGLAEIPPSRLKAIRFLLGSGEEEPRIAPD